MRRILVPATLLLSLTLLGGCQDKKPQPGVDMNALRLAVQKKTEQLYLIHLKLDTASSDITKAELKAQSGDCSAAEYLAAEAYRNIEKADQLVLELGRELQELFNLDIEGAGIN